MNPFEIISRYYEVDSLAFTILIEHGRAVADKSLALGRRVSHLNPDMTLIGEAALLHDIGMIMTEAPRIGCFGHEEYICHGYLGRDILEKEGLYRHALICERHVGMGISILDIDEKDLPLPRRNMIPETIEEKLICYADKFFSKNLLAMGREKSLANVRNEVRSYGEEKLLFFDELDRLFNT